MVSFKKKIINPLTVNAWSSQSKRWANVGIPTRPCRNDVEIAWKLVAPYLNELSNKNVIVFGVTPEMVNLPWPSHVNLSAFDINIEMINQVWAPPKNINSTVIQADWKDLPLSNHYADVMIGDGILTAVGSVDAVNMLLLESVRLLKSNGALILRCFVRPNNKESIVDIVNDVLEGKVQNFGSLKWRLAHALVDEQISSSKPIDIYLQFQKLFPDRHALSQITGWGLDEIATIDAYSAMPGNFYFPTMKELIEVFDPFFCIKHSLYGSYELSDRCPFFELILKK